MGKLVPGFVCAVTKHEGKNLVGEITGYEAVESGDMGYSVVDFDQVFHSGLQRLRFKVIATLIWKKVGGLWKEARYHSSLISVGPD